MPKITPLTVYLRAEGRKPSAEKALRDSVTAAGLKLRVAAVELTIHGETNCQLLQRDHLKIFNDLMQSCSTIYSNWSIEVKTEEWPDIKLPITSTFSIESAIRDIVSKLDPAQVLLPYTETIIVTDKPSIDADVLSKLIQTAIIDQDMTQIKTLFASYPITEISLEDQESALFEAVGLSDVDTVEYLLARGVDVNIRNSSNVTALHIACEKLDLEMVRCLLSQDGIQANIFNISELTPLQIVATKAGTQDSIEEIITELLIKNKGPRIDMPSSLLLDVDARLHNGPEYLSEHYRLCIKDILGKDIEWPQLETEW